MRRRSHSVLPGPAIYRSLDRGEAVEAGEAVGRQSMHPPQLRPQDLLVELNAHGAASASRISSPASETKTPRARMASRIGSTSRSSASVRPTIAVGILGGPSGPNAP